MADILLDNFLRPYQFLAAIEIARFTLHTPDMKERVGSALEFPDDDLDQLAGALDTLITAAASEPQEIELTEKARQELAETSPFEKAPHENP